MFVPRLVDAAPFSYSRHGSDINCKLRTLANFKKLLDYACDHPDCYAYIRLDIDHLRFDYDFLPRDLEPVSFTDSHVNDIHVATDATAIRPPNAIESKHNTLVATSK